MFVLRERCGLIVWISDVKAAKGLERYGNLYYVSRRMHYALLYINADREAELTAQIKKLHYVRRVEKSLRGEIKTEFSRDAQDKSRTYSL
ncbi:MAG TPA: YlbG family protein [Bacilli bacterium]